MVDGTRLQDRYVLEERIAVGGMGSIMSATDERLGRRVAVKMLKEELAHDPRFIERFRREARAVASLSHPNIANVFDYGEFEDHYFIVMELAAGEDLGRILRDKGRLSPERAARIGSQICEALSHAHSLGIIHRDVKPANVIVDDNDQVKVTDFGIARATGDATLTATGSVMGTAHYISPEQAGGGEITPASDQYSMGIVLFETLTGDVPFTGDSPLAIAMRHTSDPVPAPSESNPRVSPEMDAVVARATEKDPDARYPDARDMGAALTAAVSGPMTDPMGGPTVPLAGAAMAGAGAATMPEGDQPMATVVDEPTPAPVRRQRSWSPERLVLFLVLGLLALGLVAALIFLGNTLSSHGKGGHKAGGNKQAGAARTTPTPSATPTQAATATIPSDIVGQKQPDAEKALKDAGFISVKPTPATEYNSDYEPGVVVASDPSPGSTANLTDPVTLYINPKPPPSDEGGGPGENGPGENGQGKAKGKKHD